MALSSGWQKLRGAIARRAARRPSREAQGEARRAQPGAAPGAARAGRRWVWIGLALAPVALLAVLIGLLLLFDPDEHREWIADQAAARLGRPVQIGAIHWRWRPHFQLALDDVVLGAAAQGGPELARFARLRVALRPLSLLSGPLQIENLELHGLRLRLGGAGGAPPPQQQESAQQAPAASRSPLAALSRIALARAEIRDAAVSLHGADGAPALRLEAIGAQLGPAGEINASLQLRAEPHDVTGALQLAGALSTDAAAARLQPLRLALQLEGGALPGGRGALNYNGGLAFAEDGALEIAPFTLQGLGVQAAGSGRFAPPALQAQLEARGEDLPRLLKLYAQLSGGGGSLPARIAKAYDAARVARAARRFEIGGRFDVDLAAGRAEAHDLKARFLGLQLAGHLAPGAAGEAPLQGEVQLRAARSVAPLWRALGQPQLARRIRALSGSAQIEADPQQAQLALTPLKLQVTLADAAQPLALSTRAQWKQGRAELSKLRLTGPGLQLSGDLQLQPAPLELHTRLRAPQIAPRQLLVLLPGGLPKMSGAKALRRASLDGALHHSAGSWQLTLNQAQVDDTALRGEASFTPGEVQQAALNLEIGRLNLDRYLPPRKAAKSGAGASGASAEKAAEKAAEKGGGGGDWTQRLRRLALSGEVKVQELILRGLRLQQVELALRREGETFHLAPLNATAYGGRLNVQGDLNLGAAEPRFTLRGAGQKIQLGAALRDLNGRSRLDGILNLNLQLQGAALSGAALKRSLRGSADLQLSRGAYRGIDIRRQIANWRRLIGGRGAARHRDDSKARTDFEKLAAKLRIEDWVLHNDSLSASAPLLRITGKGRYRLADNHLDYRAAAHIGASRPPLSAPLPIRITGHPPRLLYIPDLSALLQESLGRIGGTLIQGVRGAAGQGDSADEEEADAAPPDEKLNKLRELLPF